MQLVTMALSPFGRKTHITALAKEIDVQLVTPASTAELAADPEFGQKNPLGKIPFLVLDDGSVLYDSPVICEYLDGLGDRAKLIPDGADRFAILTRMALADGMMDAAVAARQESVRPDGERSKTFIDKQRRVILRAVAAAATDLSRYADRFHLDAIAIAVALTYVDLRHPDLDWRTGAPDLGPWHEHMEQNPLFVATRPSV